MKRTQLVFAGIIAAIVLLGSLTQIHAGRPNPPTIAGSVPVVQFIADPNSTNSLPVAPRIVVLDERGRNVADVEAVAEGVTATFSIPLKKAGTYVVWAYYPGGRASNPQLAEVFRKQTTLVQLTWPPE
jgi:hypothetical protein